MTAYIRRGAGKKREQLERAEAAMTRALTMQVPQPRLEKIAEKLRVAHLRYLKALLHELRPDATDYDEHLRARMHEYQGAWRKWKSMTLDEIVSAYTSSPDPG